MKIVALIARILLGLVFVVFGANAFLHFIPMGPMPTGIAGQYMGALFAAHYMYPVGFIMVAGGLLLLVGLYVPLGLVLLGPILVNILLFHLLMAPQTIGMGLFCTLLWLLIFWRVRSAFYPIFCPRVTQ